MTKKHLDFSTDKIFRDLKNYQDIEKFNDGIILQIKITKDELLNALRTYTHVSDTKLEQVYRFIINELLTRQNFISEYIKQEILQSLHRLLPKKSRAENEE
ncbi:MAG: hypothetical protein ACTSVB_06350 [Candidatus Heimdallarchaeaceae archaeon]